jgi:hypothetical protein
MSLHCALVNPKIDDRLCDIQMLVKVSFVNEVVQFLLLKMRQIAVIFDFLDKTWKKTIQQFVTV